MFSCHLGRTYNVVGRYYKIYLLATSHTYDFHIVSCIGRLRSLRQMVSRIPTWFSGFLTEGSRSITHVCADIWIPEIHKFNNSTYFFKFFYLQYYNESCNTFVILRCNSVLYLKRLSQVLRSVSAF